MDLKDIQELIKFVAKSGATEVDLEIDNVKISIKSPPKKKRGEVEEVTTIIQQAPAQVVASPAAPTPVVEAPSESNPADSNSAEEGDYITIKASMIGTFYRSASPENPPFVNVGDTIKEGDPICIIEAMKIMNQIEADIDGKLVRILVENGDPVEYGQPLFVITPS